MLKIGYTNNTELAIKPRIAPRYLPYKDLFHHFQNRLWFDRFFGNRVINSSKYHVNFFMRLNIMSIIRSSDVKVYFLMGFERIQIFPIVDVKR